MCTKMLMCTEYIPFRKIGVLDVWGLIFGVVLTSVGPHISLCSVTRLHLVILNPLLPRKLRAPSPGGFGTCMFSRCEVVDLRGLGTIIENLQRLSVIKCTKEGHLSTYNLCSTLGHEGP